METIYNGVVGNQNYFVKVLTLQELPEVLALQDLVCDQLTNKEILQPLSKEEFEYIIGKDGLLIGAYVKDQLIAFRAVVAPIIDEEHLGYDIGLVNESDLKRVLYQEISSVHPDYRGHGLQKTLAKVIMEQIDSNKYDYLATTVMPYNIASLKDKFVQGFYIVALKYIYGGKLRYVFALNLRESVQFEDEVVTVSMGDIEAQQKLISEGFIGVLMRPVEDDWVVEYQKKR